MQARSGSEVEGEECRPWKKVKCSSCASASFICRLQGKQPRRRFDTVLSQQMDRNEIIMWGSTEANRNHAARVGQAWGHPRPLAVSPASLLWLAAMLVYWSVQLCAVAILTGGSSSVLMCEFSEFARPHTMTSTNSLSLMAKLTWLTEHLEMLKAFLFFVFLPTLLPCLVKKKELNGNCNMPLFPLILWT